MADTPSGTDQPNVAQQQSFPMVHEQPMPIVKITHNDGSSKTPEQATANIRRKRALPSPFTRSTASPGHGAQMQRIFQEAKSSLQLDMVFASSPSGSIASRLPIVPQASLNRSYRPLSQESDRTTLQSKTWRYSTIPPFLCEPGHDVREPVPSNDLSPCLPMIASSETEVLHIAAAEPVSSGFTSPANGSQDVDMEILPPLPDSDVPEADLFFSARASTSDVGDESENGLVTSSYGVPLVDPMSSKELEQSMKRMEVSQVDAWLHDVLDDSPSPALPKRVRVKSVKQSMSSTNEGSHLDFDAERPIYLSPSARAAADSARSKRGYTNQRSGSNKENVPPDMSYGSVVSFPPSRTPSQSSQRCSRPIHRPRAGHPPSSFLVQSSPPQASSYLPTSSTFSGRRPPRLAPPAFVRRVNSSGSPLPVAKSPPSPVSHILGSYNTSNLANNSPRFMRPKMPSLSKWYPGLNAAPARFVTRSQEPFKQYPLSKTSKRSNVGAPSASSSAQSWSDENSLLSFASRREPKRSQSPGLRPEFRSSPPRPTAYYALPPRRKRARRHELGELGSTAEESRHWVGKVAGFEIAEDSQIPNAINESGWRRDVIQEGEDNMLWRASCEAVRGDDDYVGLMAGSAVGRQQGLSRMQRPSYYDGSERYVHSPVYLEEDEDHTADVAMDDSQTSGEDARYACVDENHLLPQSRHDASVEYDEPVKESSNTNIVDAGATTPTPLPDSTESDVEVKELSPDVTPFRKGRRMGFRVSPKKRRCASFYDEDIIPQGGIEVGIGDEEVAHGLGKDSGGGAYGSEENECQNQEEEFAEGMGEGAEGVLESADGGMSPDLPCMTREERQEADELGSDAKTAIEGAIAGE